MNKFTAAAGAALAALLLAGCTPEAGTAQIDGDPKHPAAPSRICAKVGKTITVSGKTYACKGPKPYRWRRA